MVALKTLRFPMSEGFHRLADTEFDQRPLIGANGVGKTSILDVLSMLAKSAQGGLNSA